MTSASIGKHDGLHIEVVEKTFTKAGQRYSVLRNLTLTIAPRSCVCLLGPSGCGKTTLLRLVAGLDTAFDGMIVLDGHPVRGPGRERLLVFQTPRLLPWMTVADNINFALEKSRPHDERKRQVDAALQLVGLPEAAGLHPAQLSGGMTTRVALARAIAAPPRVLLLDEPFSALDHYTRRAVHDNITQIRDRHHITTLMVTHDLDEAIYLSDRVVVLGAQQGTIVADIKVDQPHPRQRQDGRFQAQLGELLAAMERAKHPDKPRSDSR